MRFPVAIVGHAWRTPLGDTLDDVIARLLAGERAVTANPRYPTGGYACTLAAPIQREPARTRNTRFLRRMGMFGMEVAHQALASSGLTGSTRVGFFSGVGGLRAHWDDMMAALADQRDDGANAWERGLRDVHPYWMLKHLSNNVHALASAELGLRGEGATFGGGHGGAQAIAAAARALHDGAIDAAVVVAHDSLLEPETLVELAARRAVTLATTTSDVASPYDTHAAGFVPGEAAAAIVIVRPADASSPYAIIDAVDAGDGQSTEPTGETVRRIVIQLGDRSAARHDEAGDDDGASRAQRHLGGPVVDGAFRAERDLCAAVVDGASRAQSQPDAPVVDGASRAQPQLDVPVVDGASRAQPELDAAERATLPPDAALISLASAMGRLGAATALVQAIALGELLRRGMLPPIAGLQHAAEGHGVPVVRATATTAKVALALSTAVPGLAAGIRVEVA